MSAPPRPQNRQARRPARSRRRTAPEGTLRVRYREILSVVKAGTSNEPFTQRFEFLPGATGMAHMDARASLYEMYKILSVRFVYKPSVGSSTNGELLMGVDFDTRDFVATYGGTAALSPKAVVPVWRVANLSVPPSRAMKQRWLLTSNLTDDAPNEGAFSLQYSNTAQTSPGTIWCEYTMEFVSPRIPTSPTSIGVLVKKGSSQGENNLTKDDPFVSPSTDKGEPFYVMGDATIGAQGLPIASQFSASVDSSIPGNSGTAWAGGKIWRVLGPSAVKWLTTVSQEGTYYLASAFTVNVLRRLAGIR